MANNEGLGNTHATDFIKSFGKQAIKQYVSYDANDRPEYIYEAPVDAANGARCTVTQYTYDGTSNRVVKMKESIGTWVSATMDI